MSLSVTPATLPVDSPLPESVQQLVNTVAAYLVVSGYDSLEGLSVSSTEPGPDQRDRVWLKTDPSSGAPLAFLAYNSGVWTELPTAMAFGATEDRPSAPVEGEQFFDSDLNIALVYERATWRTLSGSPGDVKFVKSATLEAALAKNPGWVECEEARGRVLGGAGAGAGLTDRGYLEQVGAEEHTLTEDEMPSHSHGIGRTPQYGDLNNRQSGGQQPGLGSAPPNIKTDTDSSGSGDAHNIMQPTLFMWALEKE
jgi:hypothetical protein